MGKMKKAWKHVICLMLSFCMVITLAPSVPLVADAAAATTITYSFKGSDKSTAGFAQGTITLKSAKGGNYYLYWADNKKALSGYYEIATLNVKKGKSKTFTFDEQTAIPANATKIIAIKSKSEPAKKTVAKAEAVYNIPAKKQLKVKSSDALYTFSSYSDIHIDEEHWGELPGYWWEYSERHWAQALQYSADKKVDFIVSSGDQVTNASLDNLDREWQAYLNILAKSGYVNPIYESGGNHEVRQDGAVDKELRAYVLGSGLDSTAKTINSGKSYYTMEEPKTGDLFIFMSLEGGYRPAKYDEFTDEQLDWLEGLLKENYGKGKNIYLVQHALISGYGAGDDTKTPYYSGSINPELPSAKRFISIIEQYPDIVWISGHTHEDYSLGYNYSNNGGTSCNMIHNSSVGNPTHVSGQAIDYTFYENNSQGYYVQAFEDVILFNGANLCDKKIYPAYSYIIKGKTEARYAVNENYTMVSGDKTSGELNSLHEHVGTYLAVNYEYSSYDQYQQLKKAYYQYQSPEKLKINQKQRNEIYSKLSTYFTNLSKIISEVSTEQKK